MAEQSLSLVGSAIKSEPFTWFESSGSLSFGRA